MGYLELENISKSFGEDRVLSGVTLRVDPETFCVILGPSGCGKSTLLNIVAGLERPDEGRIVLDGEDVTGKPPHRRDIAMVFQNYALYPHLTVYENMAFGLRVKNVEQEEIEEKVRQVSRILNIEDKLSQYPRQLSGGERQRVATGRAIVREPRLFLFDEPLSNLDARLRLEVRKEFLRLRKKLKKTSLYVTHDQVEAMALGDVVAVINDARIQQCSPPGKLYDDPENLFVAGFIGTPPMNILKCRLVRKDGGLRLEHGDLTLEVPGLHADVLQEHIDREVYFGIRPSRIQLGEDGYPGTLTLVETLGDENLGYVEFGGGTEMRFLFSPDERSGREGEVTLRLDPRGMYFFDEQGGRIRTGAR